jgi:hypothetical protein
MTVELLGSPRFPLLSGDSHQRVPMRLVVLRTHLPILLPCLTLLTIHEDKANVNLHLLQVITGVIRNDSVVGVGRISEV